ncbi:amidohydrolase 2 [Pleomassaria siparia CBS 279.74]|uniref:Amidohydrolase 2 n=1 Tax=Pleomassaria siparia CBS 279.74 TaxID=1314801 RepID=A0A6G1KA77_9PLEO|nr:amidohydrolase 2 [Pleomassaria siparia CBS 279.74]
MSFPRHAQSYLQPLQQTSNLNNDVKTRREIDHISQKIPANAWDSHMHTTSPDYPLASNAAYKPSLHNLQHALKFEKTIGISNIVLVQPSIYGNDNSCLLDSLRAIGPRHGRAVVGIDPDTIQLSTLEEWHKLGVRGVRLNLKSVNAQFTETSLQDMLQRYEKAIKPLNWVLELFIGMDAIPMLERAAGNLSVRLCVAHFGAPTLPAVEKRTHPIDPYSLAGFQSLLNMTRSGSTWVKMSAAYRFDEDPDMRGIEAVAKELLKRAGDRLVFASDWPHTRFEGLDVRPFVERCLQWTEAAGLTEKVFELNARDLWDA